MTKQNFDEQGLRVSDIHREVKERLQTAADADAEMSRKAKVFERKIEALELTLPKEQGLLEKMKADCRELQKTIRERNAKAAAEVEKRLRADVQTGALGVVAFHEQMTAFEKQTKAEAETVDNEISESIAAVRVKGLEVLQMENDLADAKSEYYYLLGYPTDVSLKELSKMIQEMSYRSQAIQGHLMTARSEQERAKFKLDLAKGKALVSGWSNDELTIEQVRALVFRPEIPEQYLPSLAAVILEIEANEARLLAANTMPSGKQQYLGQEGRYYLSCSFMHGLTRPWTWLCRNSNQKIQMSKASQDGGLTMSNVPTMGKIEG